MYSNFSINYSVFGGCPNGIFSDAVLCSSILYLCNANDYFIGVFVIVVFNRASGGFGSRTLSFEGLAHGFGFDDGAKGKIYFAFVDTGYYAGDSVDIDYVAANIVRHVDEAI